MQIREHHRAIVSPRRTLAQSSVDIGNYNPMRYSAELEFLQDTLREIPSSTVSTSKRRERSNITAKNRKYGNTNSTRRESYCRLGAHVTRVN